MEEYKLVQVEKDFWIIDEGGVRSFLFVGEDFALLIDSGCEIKDMAGAVKKITDLPVMLVNTHTDPDHIACNLQFEEAYMHPAEFPQYLAQKGNDAPVKPVQEGDVIDLGTRRFEVIHTPGHTPGSISLLDRENRILVGGDGVQTGEIFMFGPARDMPEYIRSMEYLISISDQFDDIYPSHADCPVKPDLMPKLLEAAKQILVGEPEWTPGEFFGTPVRVYDMGAAKFLCDAE